MEYYAHSTKLPDKSWQTMAEHLEHTAQLARDFAESFNAGEFAYLCGMLHDVGKYSKEFQDKLKGVLLAVDHSSAGAKEAVSLYGNTLGRLLAYCIAGHHSGLPDYGTAASTEGTLYARLHKQIKDYSAYRNDPMLKLYTPSGGFPVQPIGDQVGFTISFFIRMIYSCLVDADFLDTETYMAGRIRPRGTTVTMHELDNRLSMFLAQFTCDETRINYKRKEILERCLTMASADTGLYTLTVPTGGGNTYSSLAFALKHAVIHNLQRVIYVIPYTSIIEQNAKVFKDVLGSQNVLEHHSNFQFDSKDSENLQDVSEKLKLASENWDIPITVTTNVQFFESLFSNRSSRCRKLHNMTKSVIIFDEAQMLPIDYLKPCLLAVSELVKNYGTTAILCTATQPAVQALLPSSIRAVEIMEKPRQLYEDFKKVKVTKVGDLEDEALGDRLRDLRQVLCIVSTRKHAKEVYNLILDDNAFHLSTLMCPVHRQKTLVEIRHRLKADDACRVVSTQLIEAGVDVDFPVVYRSMAGIDSIVQSAGRCNREGKLSSGDVFVFEPVSEYAKAKGYLARTAQVADGVFRRHSDPISIEAIENYFKLLYDFEGDDALDKKDVIDCFEARYKQLEFDFQTAAERFRLIESNTYSIVVPYDNTAKKLLKEPQFNPYPRSLARKLQPYTISIYEYEYKVLLKNAAVSTENDSYIVLKNMQKYYHEKTGLIIPVDTYGEAIFA